MNQEKAHDMLANCHGDPAILEVFREIVWESVRTQNAWIDALRAAGIQAAHPDDGWVDREKNRVQFVYPQFNAGARPGDLIALGWPPIDGKIRHRIVRLVRFHRFSIQFVPGREEGVWEFDPVEAPTRPAP